MFPEASNWMGLAPTPCPLVITSWGGMPGELGDQLHRTHADMLVPLSHLFRCRVDTQFLQIGCRHRLERPLSPPEWSVSLPCSSSLYWTSWLGRSCGNADDRVGCEAHAPSILPHSSARTLASAALVCFGHGWTTLRSSGSCTFRTSITFFRASGTLKILPSISRQNLLVRPSSTAVELVAGHAQHFGLCREAPRG